MTHRQLYSEACRKAFADYHLPDDAFWQTRLHGRGGHANLWSKEEVERLVEYCRQGLRSFEIAKLMGRTPKAIQKAFVRFHFPSLHNICPPSGADNPAWKGGIHVAPSGYRFVLKRDHPHANKHGYVQEHRLVVEEHLGRFLLPSEVVHHKDGNHANNDISNLEVFSSNGEHLRATLSGVPHHMTPAGHERLSRLKRQAWDDPEMRKRMSRVPPGYGKSVALRWKDPVYREKALTSRRLSRLRKENQEASIRSESETCASP